MFYAACSLLLSVTHFFVSRQPCSQTFFLFKYLTGSHPSLIPRLIYRQRQSGCDCSGVLEGFHRLASCPIFEPSHPYISSSAAVIEVGMLLLFGETIAGYFSRHFRTTIRRQPHLIKKGKGKQEQKRCCHLGLYLSFGKEK